MNLLGIDYGEKRIGLATGSRIASPHSTIPNNSSTVSSIARLARDEDIELVVVGLPRGMEGQTTRQTQAALEFAELLKKSLKLPIKTIDEALTSEAATKQLGPNASKSDVDKQAAAIILQDFIEQNGQTAI